MPYSCSPSRDTSSQSPRGSRLSYAAEVARSQEPLQGLLDQSWARSPVPGGYSATSSSLQLDLRSSAIPLQEEPWFSSVTAERDRAVECFEQAVSDRDVFQQEVALLVAEWGEDRKQRERALETALEEARRADEAAQRREEARCSETDSSKELHRSADLSVTVEQLRAALERERAEKIMLQRQVEVLGASIAREIAAKEKLRAEAKAVRLQSSEQLEDVQRQLTRSREAQITAEKETRRISSEMQRLKRETRNGKGQRSSAHTDNATDKAAILREREALKEELECIQRIRQGGEESYKDKLIHKLLIENEEAVDASMRLSGMLKQEATLSICNQGEPRAAKVPDRESNATSDPSPTKLHHSRPRQSSSADLLQRVNGALQGVGVRAHRDGWKEDALVRETPHLWEGTVMLLNELEPQGKKDHSPDVRDAHHKLPVKAEGIRDVCGVTERQMNTMQDLFRKAAQRSKGRHGENTVSVKGELGLLCTNLVYKLGLTTVGTEEMDRRVLAMRADFPSVTRMREDHFLSWFSKEFIIAQEVFENSRYDGDPVWVR